MGCKLEFRLKMNPMGITKPAKASLDQADIAWIERFPEA